MRAGRSLALPAIAQAVPSGKQRDTCDQAGNVTQAPLPLGEGLGRGQNEAAVPDNTLPKVAVATPDGANGIRALSSAHFSPHQPPASPYRQPNGS